MTKKEQILGHAFRTLLLLAFLQGCSSSPGNNQPPVDNSGSTEVAPTNTSFQPVINTPTSTLEAGTLPSSTSDLAVSSPTNSADISSATSPTRPSANPASVPPVQPPREPTITPDIPTPPQVIFPPTDTPDVGTMPDPPPPLPTNTPDIGTTSPPTLIPLTQPPSTSTITPDVPTPSEPPPANPTITPDIPTAPPPGDPIIVIMPYDINAGGTLQIILEKFGGNEDVTIDVHLGTRLNNLQDSFVVTVNSEGKKTFDWTVPVNYAAGTYSVLATGQTNHKHIAGYFQVQ